MENKQETLQLPETIIEDMQRKVRKKKNLSSMFLELLAMAFFIIILLLFVFGMAAVEGNSMYPFMRDGDLAVYYRLESDYHAGDVVVFTHEEDDLVKRIVAVEGDSVAIDDETGYLLVNNVVMSDDVFFQTLSNGDKITYPYQVPKGSVFVLGDNREKSTDSRTFGAISVEQIKGKIMLLIRTRII